MTFHKVVVQPLAGRRDFLVVGSRLRRVFGGVIVSGCEAPARLLIHTYQINGQSKGDVSKSNKSPDIHLPAGSKVHSKHT